MDIFRNTPQCSNCARIWQQANCTISGPLEDAVNAVPEGTATAAAKGAMENYPEMSPAKGAAKGVNEEVGETSAILAYLFYMVKVAWNMGAGCKAE